ncbi:MAG: FtsX-like permease family protein [Promethearchaeota archaeon]
MEAIVQDSDYIYLVDETTKMPMLGSLAIVWINLETIQELKFDGNPLINQILFTVEERFNEDQILSGADDLYNYFIINNIDINSLKFEIYSENPEYLMFEADAGGIEKVGTIFGILGIIICSVIILNTLSKLVNSQRKNIGLFLAMGAKKRKILFHYVGITLFLAIIGILVGLPLGYWISIELAKFTTKLYTLHQFSYTLPIGEFIIGSAITLGICFIFSLLSAWAITTITPREAMTATFTRIKKTGKSAAEKLLGWIPLFKPIHMTVPLREVFMKKKKTLISIFALTTSMIFLVNSVALEYNMYAVMMNNFNVYHTYDVQVELETPVPVQMIENFMKNDSIKPLEDITRSEIFIDIFTKISFQDEFLGWAQLYCYQENSTLRSYNVIKGDSTEKSDLNSQEILLGNSIAGKYNLSLGDKIDLGILGNLSVEISGLVGELIDYSVLWTYESFQESNISSYFGMPKGYVNGILFTVKDDTDLKELRQVFEENLEINTWIESEVALHSTMVLMESMMAIMSILLVIGIVIGVLFSFQSINLCIWLLLTEVLIFLHLKQWELK